MMSMTKQAAWKSAPVICLPGRWFVMDFKNKKISPSPRAVAGRKPLHRAQASPQAAKYGPR